MKLLGHKLPQGIYLLFLFLFLCLTTMAAAPYRPVAQAASSDQATAPPASGTFDGPAELPRESVRSSLSSTPAPGKKRLVPAGENLAEKLASASCGDTIELEAGATFSGHFVLPAKNCDDAHWIVIRTSSPDSSLPPEGTRLTPCYAGVSSLPGRPDLHCTSTKNTLAKIEFNGKGGSGPLHLAAGANHYRLIGLEVTRADSQASVQNLIEPEGPVDHLIFDRMWFHGTAQDETVRGVLLSAARHVAVVDSFFTDFHCVARSGSCTDSQAISGGLGDQPMGPYKIANNFLEAAGESILLGGGRATQTPMDIEVRHNYMFRPTTWRLGDAHFVGGRDGHAFIVKNVFELKNAQRVLVEGNVMENVWGGFTQTGFAILLTPKNQNNKCPLCRVNDVTIRYNKVAHMASGMQLANALSDMGGTATDGGRYSIHDLLFEDIGGANYGGYGAFAQIAAGGFPLHDIKLDHITAFPPRAVFILGVRRSLPPIPNFVFSNSIIGTGEETVGSTGGGADNCAFQPQRQGLSGLLESCFTKPAVTHNGVVGGDSGWPKGNFSFKNLQAVGFVAAEKDRVGDFHLRPDSRGKHAGTDGKDLGADMDALGTATAGVL
jgi:hypothetical protein